MFKKLFIIIVLTIILVILLAIFSGASKPKKGITYSDREDLMSDAARKFFSANKKYLPKTNGGTVEISAQKLINESYLDANYAPSTCTGKVVVQNNDDSFIYIPYLDCGIGASVITLITMLILVRKNKMVRKAITANEYLDKGSINYTQSMDQFVRSHTTHYTVSSSSGGGSHGGSSGGGHSSGGGRHG